MFLLREAYYNDGTGENDADTNTATCIVAKNLAGWSVRFTRRIARLSPAAAIFASLLSFIEIIAISAQAKTAFSAISSTCSKINPNIDVSKILSPLSFVMLMNEL